MPLTDTSNTLEDESIVFHQGSSAVRVQISSPAFTISADEVITFSATLYDSVNSVVAGEIIWSSTNGTITGDGTFYPWNAGVITIQARHTNLTDEFNITVTPGIGQSLEISISTGQVLQNNILTANLIDARGNPNPTDQAAWSIDGQYFGQGNPVWIPLDIGVYHLTARLYQMEVTAPIDVASGDPYQFVFDQNIVIQSNSVTQLEPMLVDANGFAMDINLAGSKTWIVENGTVNSTGVYFATHPGSWNITVSAGPVSGSGILTVVPSDATTSTLAIIPNEPVYTAGEQYELAAYRTDVFGYSGLITPPLANFSVSSGTLSQDSGKVYWTPMSMGSQSITVIDSGIESTVLVNVVHGLAIDTRLVFSPNNLAVGQQSTMIVQAYDLAGNTWNVNGSIDVLIGNASTITNHDTYYTVVPDSVGAFAIKSSWFDAISGIVFESQDIKQVGFGDLAKIDLEGQGAKIPIDEPFDLNPRFYDSYNNELTGIFVNWTIDGEDQTLAMSLLDYHWIPSSIGSHEIQANAAGIFSVVSLTVTAGDARRIVTNQETGFVVNSGEESDLYVEIADSRGNFAPAESVTMNLNSSVGTLEPSIAGRGYWTFTGKTAGQFTLTLTQDDAVHSIALTINPGQAVQIFGEVEIRDYQQGDVALLVVYGVDSNGNIVSVEPENTSISCTSGADKYITADTWELEISKSGLDRSCSITWNGLVTQAFFDVESVLLGGAIGSTNTAMTIAAILLGLILVTMVVLVRKANYETEENDEWFDDEEYDDDYDDEEYDDDYDDEKESEPAITNQPQQQPAKPSGPVISDQERTRLATEAGKLGVMQAINQTEQGASGWYVDVSGEIQYWNVGADGSWSRGA